MPLWKITNDLISNIRLLDINGDVSLLISSYDKTLTMVDSSGKVNKRITLRNPIEIDSLEILPTAVRKINEIKAIVVGCSLGKGCIYVLNNSLDPFYKKVFENKKGGVTFVKGSFLMFNSNELVIGAPSKLCLLSLIDNEIILNEMPAEGIPVDAFLLNLKNKRILVSAEVSTKYITTYELTYADNPQIIYKFKIQANPAAIYPIWDNNEIKIIVADREGRVMLRKLNGEKIWTQHLFEPIMWRRLSIYDINNDKEKEIIIGCQNGSEDISRKEQSSLAIIDLKKGDIKFRVPLRGWIKDFKVIKLKKAAHLLVAAGKGIYLFLFNDKEYSEVHHFKFDKAVWSLDALEINNKLYMCAGFAEGEIGLGEITPEGTIYI